MRINFSFLGYLRLSVQFRINVRNMNLSFILGTLIALKPTFFWTRAVAMVGFLFTLLPTFLHQTKIIEKFILIRVSLLSFQSPNFGFWALALTQICFSITLFIHIFKTLRWILKFQYVFNDTFLCIFWDIFVFNIFIRFEVHLSLGVFWGVINVWNNMIIDKFYSYRLC